MPHSITLISGVPAVITELTGKHQRLMTQAGANHQDTIDEILADILLEVGSRKTIDKAFVSKMLSEDKRLALVMSRQHSLDFPTTYQFDYEYQSANGKKTRYPLEVSTEFEQKQLNQPESDYGDSFNYYRKIKLPKSGYEVTWQLLTGQGESIAKHFKLSSHTPIQMRQPRYLEPKSNTMISLDLDKLGLVDIEALRKHIKQEEGYIDTTVTFQHPEDNRTLTVDLLSTISFFFPSGAI